MSRLRGTALVALVGALVWTTGCAGTDDGTGRGAAGGPSTGAPAGAPATGSATGPATDPATGDGAAGAPVTGAAPSAAPSRGPVPLPELQSGHRRIASGGPTRGGGDMGRVKVGAGTTWINVNCAADGGPRPLVLEVDGVARFTVTCGGKESGTYANRLDLGTGGEGRFHVDTSEAVRWAADIQVPAEGRAG
ncbi:hypothetical protein AB0A99_01070 [Streptomyces fradiae]|uniref:hypothetical protein n=2 Tax=Streptomyces fradiae TaxID=1906 RepID=UPI0033FBE87B